MDVDVNDAWEDVLAGDVNHLASRLAREMRFHRGDLFALHAYIHTANARAGDDEAVGQQDIELLVHASSSILVLRDSHS
jgi:hypothetical protein